MGWLLAIYLIPFVGCLAGAIASLAYRKTEDALTLAGLALFWPIALLAGGVGAGVFWLFMNWPEPNDA